MNKLLLLFVEATLAIAVGVGLLVSGIVAGIGAALIVIGIALYALYAILLNQKYHLSTRRRWRIEHERDVELARIEANKTVTLQTPLPRTATC